MAIKELLAVCMFINVANAWFFNKRGPCCDEIEEDFCFESEGWFSIEAKCPATFSPTFTLYTRDLTASGMAISKDNIPSAFSNDRKTVYIVHGWTDTFNDNPNFIDMKDALLEKDDLNVIGVDWRNGASPATYVPAAANTQAIGALIGALTNTLRSRSGANPHFWCIGHSLGAHGCGYSSLTADPVLERITGLDPAGPYFGRGDKGLMKSSAAQVDIMHTDPILGSKFPRGHVDFYPNGGRRQPGCLLSGDLSSVFDADQLSDEQKLALMQLSGLGTNIANEFACSHLKAVEFMINSIRNSPCYTAKDVCTDYRTIPGSCTRIQSGNQHGVMGYPAVDFRYDGILYFDSDDDAPFCAYYN